MSNTRLPYLTLACLLGALVAPAAAAAAADDAWFDAEVLPVLRNRCFECHSHAAGKMKGGLALDYRSGWATGGDAGPAVVPARPDESLLVRAVRHADPDLRMPPKAKLPEAEVAVLTEWVRRGAPDPRAAGPRSATAAAAWWSLKPLVRPAVPPAAGDAVNPVDAFVRAALAAKKLSPSPEADRRALIRRVSFDLTGLPPTPAEVDAFAADAAAGAYERVVDRLLASPRYGERWARHWLDAVHFADTHGFEHDVFRPNAWRYRDYVIDALNRDTPWPRFVREQLAADHFYADDPRLTAALGFLGAGPYDASAAGTAPKAFENLDRDDLVAQTAAAFLGTTAACARCHDHKFDPVSQQDYYALQAVFAGVSKGDLAYDEDPAVFAARRNWDRLLAAAKARDAAALASPEATGIAADWENARNAGAPAAAWEPVAVETFLSSDGTTLRRLADGTIEATGTRPERDTYTLTVSTALPRVTAIRLDLLSDPSLPKGGPGRADNGNLHLTAFEAKAFRPGEPEPKPVTFRRATADWDQDGWTVANALDGDPKTAWGIYPRVGEPHHAVFELAEPLDAPPATKLVIDVRQLHGGGHVIGRLRVSATSAPVDAAAALPAAVEAAATVPSDHRSAAQRLDLAAYAVRLRATAELAKLPAKVAVYASVPTSEPKVVRVLKRGDVERPGDEVGPGAVSAIAALPGRFELANPRSESARRAALADWLVDARNPLSWRSIANRVWHHHFGRGLCDTPNDLGRMGGVPSHPELLDYLACELRDGGPGGAGAGSLKHLHRLIVTSAAYKQSSAGRPDAAAVDADNRLLWRGPRLRLDAESYRDAVLAASGRLDLTTGGPGVQQFKLGKPVQSTPTVDYTAFDWDAPGAGRRSVYRVVWRAIPDPFMEALDFPDASLLAGGRGFSASPAQALALMNNAFVLRHAEHLAARVAADSKTPEDQVAAAVRLALQRDATADERAALSLYAKQHGLPAACRLILNLDEFLFVD